MADIIKINSYTDESGQDTKGKYFVVCTVAVLSKNFENIEEIMNEIEKESDKYKKWHNTGNKRRHSYVKHILESGILNRLSVFYSVYQNKNEYTTLIGAHIAKAILAFTGAQKYEAKVFIDKLDKKALENIKKEIKSFHIRYKKIRGLSEESSSLIRLADAICGAIRDLDNKNVANSYKQLFKKLNMV